MKVLCIFGTRPEAIKMAPVIRALKNHPSHITPVVCVTAQHRQMLDQVLELFAIKPDYDLAVMKPDQALVELTAHILTGLTSILEKERPDWVLVQGDTTTAMVASLAAFYQRIKVGHIEAGLRTGDKYQPFPEEINRRMVSVIADLHFAPTELARQNLLREGIENNCIAVTGNTVIDALLDVAHREYDWNEGPLAKISRDKPIILVTAHRRENFGTPLKNICAALREIAARTTDAQIVYPVHLNPNVRGVVEAALGNMERITLLEPLDYLPLVQLMKASYMVLTDSGGIQEEAPGLGKPVLVLRDVTERPEGVRAETVRLVGTEKQRIVTETLRLLYDNTEYESMAQAVNPYGDGRSGERIVQRMMQQNQPSTMYSVRKEYSD